MQGYWCRYSRFGRKFLYSGCGYGGSCFPKDIKTLIKTAEKNEYSMNVLKAVEEVNEAQKSVFFEKLIKKLDGDLKNKHISILGLAFKPETDDMREATSLVPISKILAERGFVKSMIQLQCLNVVVLETK